MKGVLFLGKVQSSRANNGTGSDRLHENDSGRNFEMATSTEFFDAVAKVNVVFVASAHARSGGGRTVDIWPLCNSYATLTSAGWNKGSTVLWGRLDENY